MLELLELLCRGAETLSGASPAYLYRRIGEGGPVTILLDEADAIWNPGRGKAPSETNEALRAIVNAGHRKTATVGRVQVLGNHAELVRFRCYAPAAIAAIGRLPDTIEDRSVILHMQRRQPGQRIREYRQRVTGPEGAAIAEKLLNWAASVRDRIGQPWPQMPPGVTDRPADVWEPLLMVADLAGGAWPLYARTACITLTAAARQGDEARDTRLLADIRDAFGPGPGQWTSVIVPALNGLDEAEWGSWHNGAGITDRDIAKILRPYQVRPRDVRIGDAHKKGYLREHLGPVWDAYLAPLSATSATSATPQVSGLNHPRHERDTSATPPASPVADVAHTQSGRDGLTCDVADVALVAANGAPGVPAINGQPGPSADQVEQMRFVARLAAEREAHQRGGGTDG